MLPDEMRKPPLGKGGSLDIRKLGGFDTSDTTETRHLRQAELILRAAPHLSWQVASVVSGHAFHVGEAR